MVSKICFIDSEFGVSAIGYESKLRANRPAIAGREAGHTISLKDQFLRVEMRNKLNAK